MKKATNFERIKTIIEKGRERIISVPERLFKRVGTRAYIEMLSHNQICFRRRMINYQEVNKLESPEKALLIGLVSHLRQDNYVKLNGKYLDTNQIVKSFGRVFYNKTDRYILGLLNKLIEQGFVEQKGSAEDIKFKLTAKAIMPHDKNKVFIVESDTNKDIAS